MRYAAQSFLDGFTSMASVLSPAVRPGSDVPLFLSDSPSETVAFADRTIMADVEHILCEVEPLLFEDQNIHRQARVLMEKIQKSQSTFYASHSGM